MRKKYVPFILVFLLHPQVQALDYTLRSGITYSANNVHLTSFSNRVFPDDKVGFDIGVFSTLPISSSFDFRFGIDLTLRKAHYSLELITICAIIPPATSCSTGPNPRSELKRSTYYLDLPLLMTYKRRFFEVFSGVKIPIMLFEDLERERATLEAPRSSAVFFTAVVGVGVPITKKWGIELFYENGITYAVDDLGVRIRSNRYGFSGKYSF